MTPPREPHRDGGTMSSLRKLLSALRPGAVRAATRMRRWRAVVVLSVLAVWVASVVWLMSTSPTIRAAGIPARLVCQPIGGDTTDRSALRTMTTEDDEFVYAYVAQRLDADSLTDGTYTQVDMQVEIARVCAEARTNRMASLIVVVGAGLALAVVGAPWVALGRPTVKPSPPAPDAGAVRRERPPPRPPGLSPRTMTRPEHGPQP